MIFYGLEMNLSILGASFLVSSQPFLQMKTSAWNELSYEDQYMRKILNTLKRRVLKI